MIYARTVKGETVMFEEEEFVVCAPHMDFRIAEEKWEGRAIGLLGRRPYDRQYIRLSGRKGWWHCVEVYSVRIDLASLGCS